MSDVADVRRYVDVWPTCIGASTSVVPDLHEDHPYVSHLPSRLPRLMSRDEVGASAGRTVRGYSRGMRGFRVVRGGGVRRSAGRRPRLP